jgi:hypothetical protein
MFRPRSAPTSAAATVAADSAVAPDVKALLLARRLLPAAIAVLIASSFYVAGFFFDAMLTLPLMAMATVVVAAETLIGYRADVGYRDQVAAVRRVDRAREAASTARYNDAVDALGSLAAGARRLAAVPTLLTAQLAVLSPQLAELVATRSPAKRSQLLAQLEADAVESAREVLGVADGTGRGRAILFRCTRRRFDGTCPRGDWRGETLGFARRTQRAAELRAVFNGAAASVAPVAGPIGAAGPRWAVSVPLRAGRRHLGVLYADRPGEPIGGDELEALAVIGRLLAAAMAAGASADPWGDGLAGVGLDPAPAPVLRAGALRVRAELSSRVAAAGRLRDHRLSLPER